MANVPVYSVRSGGMKGGITDGQFGLQPYVVKPKKTKEGEPIKENGKQVYTTFYNKNDMKDMAVIATMLYQWLLNKETEDFKQANAPANAPAISTAQDGDTPL